MSRRLVRRSLGEGGKAFIAALRMGEA
jgi:hypothetical protein